MEDAAAEKLAETSNLRSMREILSARGESIDKKYPEIIFDREQLTGLAIEAAERLSTKYPAAKIDVPVYFRELMYGPNPGGVQLAIAADTGSGETKATANAKRGGDDENA